MKHLTNQKESQMTEKIISVETTDFALAIDTLVQNGLKKLVVVSLKIKRQKIYLHVNTSLTTCVIQRQWELLKKTMSQA